MFVDLLLKPVSGLGPNARFFLAAFAMRFGGEGAVLLTVKELARRLMISSRLVTEVVPELATYVKTRTCRSTSALTITSLAKYCLICRMLG